MANRTVVMPGVWANDAQTTIPVPPVSNTSYRNNGLTEQTINNGWGYSTIVNSADYNQFMYLLTQFLKTVENSGGILPFCMTTTYNKNGYAIGSDSLLYISQKDDNIGNDPTEDDGTNWKTFAQVYLSNFVTLDTNQTIAGQKTFTNTNTDTSIPIIFEHNTNQQEVPSATGSSILALYRNKVFSKGDGISCWVRGIREAGGTTSAYLFVRRFLETDENEIIDSVGVGIDANGNPYGRAPTPAVGSNSTTIATTAYVNTKFQVVSALPASPDSNVFYFIPE